MSVLLQGDADPAPSLTSQGLPLQKQPLHVQYLPFLVSCCRMFLIKWTFLKFFGLGDPESVRHLKNKSVAREGREKEKKKKVLSSQLYRQEVITKAGRKDETNDSSHPVLGISKNNKDNKSGNETAQTKKKKI